MKIAHILPSLTHSGPTLVAKDIIKHLPSEVEVEVFFLDDKTEVKMPCPTKKTNMQGQGIEWDKYDIVHSHMLRPDILVWLNRKKILGKTVSTLHNYAQEDLEYQYNKLISRVFSPLWKTALQGNDCLIALSKDMKSYYEKLYRHPSISYIYNGRDIDSILPLQDNVEDSDIENIKKFKGNSILIGAAALLTDRKGLDQVIRMLAIAPEFKLIIIGHGKVESKLKNLASNLGVLDRCLFLGFRKGAHRYYNFFDLYAMPSRSEGFPLAMLEAAAFGLPIICSDIPVFKEVFEEGEVMFFKLNDILDLKVKAQVLYSNKENFSKKVSQKYQQVYTAQHMAKHYQKLYSTLNSNGS